MSGLDEAVIKNVEACKQLSKITRTSLGPNGASTPPPNADLALKNEQTPRVAVNVQRFAVSGDDEQKSETVAAFRPPLTAKSSRVEPLLPSSQA